MAKSKYAHLAVSLQASADRAANSAVDKAKQNGRNV